jgi:hypothetical protein
MPARRSTAVILPMLAIFLVALGLRMAFVYETHELPGYRTTTPGMDVDIHWRAAQALNAGADLDQPIYELMLPSAPLQVYWLAFWQRILGAESMQPHRLLNSIIGAGSAALMGALLFRLMGSTRAAWLGGLLWACMPSLVFFDASLHKSALSMLLLLCTLCAAMLPSRPLGSGKLLIQGLALGLFLSAMLLLQLNTFLYALVLIPFLLTERQIKPVAHAVRILPLLMLVAASWLSVAQRQHRDDSAYPWFWPQKGIHLRIGYQSGAAGGYHNYADITPLPYGHVFQSRLYAESVLDRRLSPTEADELLTAQALTFIREQPVEALGIALTKAGIFFNDFEPKGVDYLPHVRNQSAVIAWLPFGLGLLVTFAGLGIIHLLRQGRYRQLYLIVAILGSTLAANIIAFVSWRYRLHELAPLMLLAALGAREWLQQTARLKSPGIHSIGRYAATVIVPLALCVWLAYRPVLESEKPYFERSAVANNEFATYAESVLAQIETPQLQSDPLSLGIRLMDIHRYTEARQALVAGGACAETSQDACVLYVSLLLWVGDYEEVGQLMAAVAQRSAYRYGQIVMALSPPERRIVTRFIEPQI